VFSILGLGQRLRPELDAIFISHPDKTAAQLPSARELKQYWDEVNAKLHATFASLSAAEWLQPHYAMSAEDYAKDPTRLAVMLSQTNHLSHHLGQVTLAIK
jgi:uncharacterized damage-inducible protein DinB